MRRTACFRFRAAPRIPGEISESYIQQFRQVPLSTGRRREGKRILAVIPRDSVEVNRRGPATVGVVRKVFVEMQSKWEDFDKGTLTGRVGGGPTPRGRGVYDFDWT